LKQQFLVQEQVLLLKTAAEISLKSHYVENYFLKKLRENIRSALKANNLNENVDLQKLRGRILISGGNQKKIFLLLPKIFGIHAIAKAKRFDVPSIENIVACSVDFAKTVLQKGDSFAVRARRSGNHSFSSQDLNVAIGAAVLKAIPGLKVNLDSPKRELFVEVYEKEFFVFSAEIVGARGLPLGVEGNIAFLFSGKKTELLAAWLLMKRGCNVFPVFKNNKAKALLKKLLPWNSFRPFSPTAQKDLDFLVQKQGILAIATSDVATTVSAVAGYKEFDAKFVLPVLRPLLFLPKKDLLLPKEFL
jgi:adenylyl- and sulfurtransferase ThiI